MAFAVTPSCPRCLIGQLESRKTTYSRVHHGIFLSVPNTPCWTCDICQYQELDDAALSQIEALVGQLGLSADLDRRSAKLPSIEGDLMDKRPSRLKP